MTVTTWWESLAGKSVDGKFTLFEHLAKNLENE